MEVSRAIDAFETARTLPAQSGQFGHQSSGTFSREQLEEELIRMKGELADLDNRIAKRGSVAEPS
jgi:hypothetical protein